MNISTVLKKEGVRRGEETSNGGGERRSEQSVAERRVLRGKYLVVRDQIVEERDDIAKVDMRKFNEIFNQVEDLHKEVQKPREQVADAEALLDIATTLSSACKSQGDGGITPADFITSLLKEFGNQNGGNNSQSSIVWGDVGFTISHIFRKPPGFCTMTGVMNMELKERKVGVRQKRVKPTASSRPEDLGEASEEKTDTDRNMAVMFGILKKNRHVRLESLILNRNSFAQTIENLFALSFLVKEGRAQIAVDEKCQHIVFPKNAPSASDVCNRDVSYSHFVFRFDSKDWKLMKDCVSDGDELMPHRSAMDNTKSDTPEQHVPEETQGRVATTPIRKLTRNRGLVIQKQSVLEESPENEAVNAKDASPAKNSMRSRDPVQDDDFVVEDTPENVSATVRARATAIRRGKRKLLE